MRQILPALFLSLLVTATAQSPLQPVLPGFSTVDELGAQLFANSGAVGMVVVVVRDDQVFFHGYGETAPNSHIVPSTDSVVRLCSVTKIFTTDLLTKLVKQQIVRLDDPLQRYAPKRALVPLREQPITLEELATHTSGLPRELGARPRKIPPFAYPDFTERWQWLPRQSLASVPGSAALYSNIGFDLLSDALEAAAHKPYAALLAEQTLNPLNMRQTTYYPNAIQCDRLLRSSHDEGACSVTEATQGSAGLYSTPADMAIWLKYLLGTGSPAVSAQDPAAQAIYLEPAQLKKQFGLDHAGKPSGIGLGWMHLLPVGDPSHIIEKTGGGAGFSSYIAILPARRTAIFFAFAEGSGWKQNIFKDANNMMLNLVGLPPMSEEPAKHLSRTHSKPRPKRRHQPEQAPAAQPPPARTS
jgi:D-alanyl-D-alanine-carboxypeptidase/D-alanyl-D-alanine-endopeptidase